MTVSKKCMKRPHRALKYLNVLKIFDHAGKHNNSRRLKLNPDCSIKCDYFCGMMARCVLKCFGNRAVFCQMWQKKANCSQALKVATAEDNQTYVTEKIPQA